jgi:hypothetical protein
MGSLVRESLEAYLAAAPSDDDPALGIIGSIDDADLPRPHGSVAEHHDAYLVDAIEAEGREPDGAPWWARRPRR